jgi:hypothetical protein
MIRKGKKEAVSFAGHVDTCEYEYLITKMNREVWKDAVTACRGDRGNKAPIIKLVDTVIRIDVGGEQVDYRRMITIDNKSQFDADIVRVKPKFECWSELSCWSPNLLVSPIRKGKSLEVEIDGGPKACAYEYRITKTQSGRAWIHEIDACSEEGDGLPKIELFHNVEDPKDGKLRLVKITNKSPSNVIEVFAKPKGKACCWSPDLLGYAVIRGNASLEVDFDDGLGTCQFDLRIAFQGGRRGDPGEIDACVSREMTATSRP